MEHKLFMVLKQVEDCPVRGHLKMIDDTRLVFVGEDPGDSERVYLAFRNADGKDTKITLSREAYQALKFLINEPFKGERTRFPYKFSWDVQVTEQKPVDNSKEE